MKITRATLKSFVKKNREKLYINVKSDFDGCVDGCVDKKGGFHLALEDGTLGYNYHTLNIQGVWLTGRDYFCKFEDGCFKGIEVSNSCGCFILAIIKT